jgi:hypothetical protein
MPRNSPVRLKSMTTLGRLMRSFSQSKESIPPAITNAFGLYRSRSVTASAVLSGWKSSNAGITS